MANTVDGYLYKGGEYAVTLIVKSRSTGRTLLERELLATEVQVSSIGIHTIIDVKDI